MKQRLEQALTEWKAEIISDKDICCFFEGHSRKNQNDMIQRAVSWGWLQRIKRGLYIIGPPFSNENVSQFELAQHIYGPSYISMQSALSYHQMIPEAVYATVSVTAKRSREFDTPLGLFLFHHTPITSFYSGVERVREGRATYLIASPLKALGDYIYVSKNEYKSVAQIENDLRIDQNILLAQPPSQLKLLEQSYGSKRVQNFYRRLGEEFLK